METAKHAKIAKRAQDSLAQLIDAQTQMFNVCQGPAYRASAVFVRDACDHQHPRQSTLSIHPQ
jgi:hypothetical protein